MKRISQGCALALLAMATTAVAAPPEEARAPAAAPAGGDAPFSDAKPIDAGTLAHVTGRADTAMAIRANNTSTVSNNSVIGQSQTGTVNFDGQAFGNLSGLSLVSANTGNNVSINSSMNLNVAIRP